MSHRYTFWGLMALFIVLGVTGGYVLSLTPIEHDMLDAVAVVQRNSPRFVVSDPIPGANWAKSGSLYLCRTPRTAEELDGLNKGVGGDDPRWEGILCFKGIDNTTLYVPWVSEAGPDCVHYRSFAIWGDPAEVKEVQALLAAEGIEPPPEG